MSSDLELARRRYELEKIFDSMISKIPDLCHPPAIILEGEDDFFNLTKDLKLEPFRTQDVFERCVTPTLDDLRHEAISSPTGSYKKVGLHSKAGTPAKSSRSKAATKKEYPFANPIPDCMLAIGHDDLNKLVWTHEIEWKMLTRVRPPNDHEEKYFDQLVRRRRSHNKHQVETVRQIGGVGASSEADQNQVACHSHVTPFMHTRHEIVLTPSSKTSDRNQLGRRELTTSVSLGVRLKGRFHSNSRTSITGQLAKTDSIIPTLTFTTEDEIECVDSEGQQGGQERLPSPRAIGEIDKASNSDSKECRNTTGDRLMPAASEAPI